MKSLKNKRECGVCSTAIFEYDSKTGKLRKSAAYNEVDVMMSDKSVMTLGVCLNHTKLAETDMPVITKKVHDGWLEEVAYGIGNKAWVNKTGLNLAVVGVY